MPSATRTLALALLVGCIPPRPDTGDTSDTDVTSTCPAGMAAARDPGLFVNVFRYNGLNRSLSFEEGTVLGGTGTARPAACIATDGRAVDFIALYLDEPYARIAMSAPLGGDQAYDLNGTEASVTIEVFGEDDAPTFTNGDFVAGTWYVVSVGDTFDSDLAADAFAGPDGVYGLTIGLTIEGSR